MKALTKNFGKLNQLVGEKFANAAKHELSDDFKLMEQRTEVRKNGIESILESCQKYCKTLEKTKEGLDRQKHLPIELLGISMVAYGSDLNEESIYGQSLVKMGEIEEKIGGIQTEFVKNTRQTLVAEFEQFMVDVKTYKQLRSKLESRRLDYDAKTNRIQKAKKEKPDLDEEMKQAQQKYEDTLQEVENLMISLEGREDSQLSALLGFLDAQFEFHTQAAKLLGDLKISIRDSSVPANRIQRPTQLFSESNASLNNLVARNGSETLTADQSQSSKTNLFSSGADASSQPSSPITNNSNRKISALSASTPLPQPPTRKLVRANYSFMAENANEISLQKGDTVTVVNEIDAGWWVGENQKNGETGLFPANYCEVIGQTASAVTGVEEARPVQPPPPRQPPLLSVLQKNSSLPRFTYTQQSQSQPQPQQAPPERPKRSESSEALEAAAAAVQQQKSAGSSPVPPKPPRRSDSPGPEQAVAPPIVKSRSQVSLSNETKPPTVPSRSPSNQDLSKVSTCQTCACSQFSPGAFKADQCKNCFHSHQ